VKSVALEVAIRTDPGRDPEKQVNEDAALEEETRFGRLVVVADGMGGHAGGREASHLAIRVIQDAFTRADAATPGRDVLANAIREANRRVFTMTTPLEEGGGGGRPGSTVVAALVHEDGMEVAHVGDSRAYLVHTGQIFQLTKDHSMVQRLVDDGLLAPAEAARHPEANKILRALGIAEDVDVDVRPQPTQYSTGDVLLLCSDGLSDLVSPGDILAIAGGAPPAQAAGQLVDLANARGGHDNITVAVVRAKESSLGKREPVAPTLVQTPGPPATGTVMQVPAPRPAMPSDADRMSARGRTLVRAIAVAVALVGIAVAVVVIVMHNDRGGAHRNVPHGIEPLPVPTEHAPHVELHPMDPTVMPVPQPPSDVDAAIEPLSPPDAGRRRRP
jgi:PPM family protein phosphatase